MVIYIVRHAWAVDADAPCVTDDASRPLTREGRKRFARVVKKLVKRQWAPDCVISSPLVRCRETAEIIAAHAPGKPEIVIRDELAPGSDLDGLLAFQRERNDESVAWVGHAPDVTHLCAALMGDRSGTIRFAKGATAAIQFDGPPARGRGELEWLVTAPMLGC